MTSDLIYRTEGYFHCVNISDHFHHQLSNKIKSLPVKLATISDHYNSLPAEALGM